MHYLTTKSIISIIYALWVVSCIRAMRRDVLI